MSVDIPKGAMYAFVRFSPPAGAEAGLARERLLPAYGARPNLGPEPRDAFLFAWARTAN